MESLKIASNLKLSFGNTTARRCLTVGLDVHKARKIPLKNISFGCQQRNDNCFL